MSKDNCWEMRFALVRSSDPKCGFDCPEWISAEGAITADTPGKLRQLLDVLGDRRLPLLVSSPGGDVFSAMVAGRLIRDRKLDVAIARTAFVECAPDNDECAPEGRVYAGVATYDGGQCDAACPILFAGGVTRVVGNGAHLSVHYMAFEQKVGNYLDDMNIGRGFFLSMRSALSVDYLQLDPDTMLKVGLTTGPQSADALTGATICKSTPRPENCRVLQAPNAEANVPTKT